MLLVFVFDSFEEIAFLYQNIFFQLLFCDSGCDQMVADKKGKVFKLKISKLRD